MKISKDILVILWNRKLLMNYSLNAIRIRFENLAWFLNSSHLKKVSASHLAIQLDPLKSQCLIEKEYHSNLTVNDHISHEISWDLVKMVTKFRWDIATIIDEASWDLKIRTICFLNCGPGTCYIWISFFPTFQSYSSQLFSGRC